MSHLKVARRTLNDSLTEFVSKSHGVIYGAPGAGKTYAIGVLADSLIESGMPSIVVPVEQLSDGSPGEVFEYLKSNLGETNVNEIPLRFGSRGIFFLDGYDAARDPSVEANLQKAISRIKTELSNWHLIVTIREYDLEKNLRLQKLLNLVKIGKNKNVFKIDEFSEGELAEGLSSAGFNAEEIFRKGSIDFRRLLQNPFSLWLFTRVFDPKDSAKYFLLQTEAQLLNAYFDRLVGSDPETNSLISKVTQSMVSKGTLSVEYSDVNGMGSKESIDHLLSDEIFVQSFSGKNRIHFKHNLLFDYAVSHYCFEREPRAFIDYLLSDKRRSLFLQQSLKFFFFDIWDKDKALYWSLLRLMYENKQPAVALISKTVPFLPIVGSLSNISDLDSATGKFDSFRNFFTKYLLFGYQVYPDTNLAIRPSVYKSLSSTIDESFVWSLSVQASLEADRFTQDDDREKLSAVLISANNFVEKHKFAFSPILVANWILPGFIKTLDQDRHYKVNFVRKILTSIGTEGYSVQQLYRICSMAETIVDFEPSLAEEVYEKVFEYKEKSEDAVNMGSPILPLRSNKRQDYDMCFFQLNEAIDYFLEKAPNHGVIAGIKAGEKEIFRSHLQDRMELQTIEIESNRYKYEVILDYSYIWGDGSRLGDYGLQIVEKAIGYIGTLIEKDQSALAVDLFEQAKAYVKTAFAWKLLLEVAARHPKELAPNIALLISSPQVLLAPDLDYSIGNTLEVIYANVSGENRSTIEAAISDMDSFSKSDELRVYDMKLKDKYIMTLPQSLIARADIKERREALSSSNNVAPKFEKHYAVQTGWVKYDHDDYLKEEGVNMGAQETKEGLSLIEEFEKTEFTKEKLSSEAISKLGSFLVDLSFLLETVKDKTLHSDILRRTLDKLDKHFFEIDQSQAEIFKIAFEFAKRGAYHPHPEFNSKYHSKFDSPLWSSAPRIEAAELICKVALRLYNPEVKVVIEMLAVDQVPAVRYLIATEIFRIFSVDQSLFWKTMKERSSLEANRTIKTALLSSLIKVYTKDIGKSEETIQVLFNISQDDHLTEMLGSCVVDLAIRSIGTFGKDKLKQVISNPTDYRHVLRETVLRLSSELSFRSYKETPEFFGETLKYAASLVQSCGALLSAMDRRSDELREVYGVISEFVTRLYFNTELKGVENLTPLEGTTYFRSLAGLIDELVKVATTTRYLDASTVHYFVQMMGNIVEYLPRPVVFWTHQVVTVGKSGDYHIDPMAVKEVVELVEVLLATNKEGLSRNTDELEAIIHLLDIFAEVGQAEALKATWKLDSVFR